MAEGNTPEQKFSTGAIQATVWRNAGKSKNGEDVEFNTISLQRRYKDKDGWKSSGSFSRNEIPLTIYCLQKCFEHIIEGQDDSVEEEVVM